MSTTESSTLTYDVFVNDPPPQDGMLPNGEPKLFSPMASTLICGSEELFPLIRRHVRRDAV